MTCADALERLLVADPAALRGDAGADLELAAHLEGCGRCRTVAGTLAAELTALDREVEALAGRAIRSASGSRSTESRRPGWWRRGRWAWLPLATAAVLATILVLPRGERAGAGARVGALPTPRETPLAVSLPEDRGGVVMSTGNPRITVVWLYERSEQ
ncbi:MAG TPA: hypothetical protein VM778_11125 [Gemmatimonadota bacterium]|nr:hypothetical protein [Gemmatimonadota bacterium]